MRARLGVKMAATYFLYDSFVDYFTPVYPGAFPARIGCATSLRTRNRIDH